MSSRPQPDAVLLAEVAERHRVTEEQVLREWHYGRYGGHYPLTLEEAAEWAYRSRSGLQRLAREQSRQSTARIQEIADRYGLSFMDIVRERRDGDWPDHERAARALVERRTRKIETPPAPRAGLQPRPVPLEWKLLAVVLPLLILALAIALRPS